MDKNTYGISSSSGSIPSRIPSRTSSRVGISNISMCSLNDTLGVLLPEDGAEKDVSELGVCGDVVNNTMLSVDTDGVSVMDNRSAGLSIVDSLCRVNVSLYTGLSSRSSSPLFSKQ